MTAVGIFFAIVCALMAAGGAYIAIKLDPDAAKHQGVVAASFATVAAVGVIMSLAIGGIL